MIKIFCYTSLTTFTVLGVRHLRFYALLGHFKIQCSLRFEQPRGSLRCLRNWRKHPPRPPRIPPRLKLSPVQQAHPRKPSSWTTFSPHILTTHSKEGDPAPREPTPISAYNQWPPFNNPQHPAYLAATPTAWKRHIRTTQHHQASCLRLTVRKNRAHWWICQLQPVRR